MGPIKISNDEMGQRVWLVHYKEQKIIIKVD